MRPVLRGLSVLVASILASAAPAQTVWRVDDDAANGGDGKSWATAFRFLQDALAVAQSADEIWIAGGRHRPDVGAGHTWQDRDETFLLVDGVALLGGFEGLKAGPNGSDRREWNRWETTLHGDLNNNDDYGVKQDNSRHVCTAPRGATVVLDRITIRSGATSVQDGANVRSNGANLKLIDVLLAEGSAFRGGGLAAFGGSLETTNCSVQYNMAELDGGGVYLEGVAATIRGGSFFDNEAKANGGAICSVDAPITVDDVVVRFNRAVDGAGISMDSGTLVRCTFWECTATGLAGAIHVTGAGVVDTRVVSTLCYLNQASSAAAVRFDAAANSKLTLQNLTIAHNTSSSGPGGAVDSAVTTAGALVVDSSILFFNEMAGLKGESAQISAPAGALAIDCCDVQGWSGGLGGAGNFSAPPMFVGSNYYELEKTSPCLEVGNPGFVSIPGEELGLGGYSRKLDRDFDRVARVDIGAYELPHAYLNIYGDFKPAGVVFVDVLGTGGLSTMLVIGMAQATNSLDPLGTMLVDPNGPILYVPWGVSPSNDWLTIPPNAPVPTTLYLQALVTKGNAGNFSNVVTMLIE